MKYRSRPRRRPHATLLEALESRTLLSTTAGHETPAAAVAYNLSETFVSTTLGASLVSGTKVNGKVTLKVTEGPDAAINAKSTFTLSISTASGTAGTVLSSTLIKLSLKPGHSTTVSLPVSAIPSVAAGQYFLVVQVTDPNGQVSTVSSPSAGAIAAPFYGLSESITATTLPVALVSGTAIKKGALQIKVSDLGNIPLTGKSTIVISASTTSGIPGTTIASFSQSLSIKTQHFAIVNLPITEIPALPDGNYYLVVQVTDPLGVTTTTSTPSTGRIAAPFVALSATFGTVTHASLTSGATITLTNTGNVPDKTTLTETLGFSTDAAGLVPAGSSSHVTTPTLTIPAGGSLTLHINVWKALVASTGPGTYYLTATITDASGVTTTAVSAATVTIA